MRRSPDRATLIECARTADEPASRALIPAASGTIRLGDAPVNSRRARSRGGQSCASLRVEITPVPWQRRQYSGSGQPPRMPEIDAMKENRLVCPCFAGSGAACAVSIDREGSQCATLEDANTEQWSAFCRQPAPHFVSVNKIGGGMSR